MTGAGDRDDVIFTGAGTTAAVELLVHLLDLENVVSDDAMKSSPTFLY